MYIANQSSNYATIEKTLSMNEEFIGATLKALEPKATHVSARKMSMRVDKDTEFLINGKNRVLVTSQFGFEMNYEDKDIETMVALTDNVKVYAFIGY